MRFYRLKEVSKMLGGTPSYRELKDACHEGTIEFSQTFGRGVYLLSERQFKRLVEQLEGSDARTTTAR